MRKRKYSSLTPGNDILLTEDESCPHPVIHNIVATSQITGSMSTLDLNQIHEMLPFSFYDQRKFAAITVWLHQPVCTTLLFSSGKLVVTGCRTWYQCVYASLCIAKLLCDCIPGHVFRLQACDVQNMVAHVEVPVQGGTLDLQAMYTQMALNCTYQRKMFPGLIYRPEASPVVLLCFFSGKIVITGGKTMDDVFSGWRRLWPTLKRYIVLPAPAAATGSPHANGDGGNRAEESGGACRELHQSLALVRDPAADEARGGGEGMVEGAGSGGCGEEPVDLLYPSELQGLGDDLAAECPPLLLGRGIAWSARQGSGEPRAPHGKIVKLQTMCGGGPAEIKAGVVLAR